MSFETNLAAQFARITALHPQLLDAVPPEPIERRKGTFSLNVAQFWEEFCAREWQPRAGRDETLVGPFAMFGECLSPLIPPGESHWYDPTLPARDGDIVLVRWDPAVLRDMYQRHGSDADWLRQYGQPCPIATKIYKTIGASQYLLTRQSALQLGQNRILGVLRRRVRDGVPIGTRVSAIEPEAATSAYNQTDDTESVTLLAQTVMSIAVPAVITDHVAQVTASFDVWRNSNGAGSRVVFLQQDGSATAYNVRRVESLADPGERVSLLAEFTQPRDTAFTYELNYLGVNVGDTAEFRNISMRVEIIKR